MKKTIKKPRTFSKFNHNEFSLKRNSPLLYLLVMYFLILAPAGKVTAADPVSSQTDKGKVHFTIKEEHTILTAPQNETKGDYYGRPSLSILEDGTWVMVYIRSNHHWKDPQGRIEVIFSKDEGRSWSAPNTYTDGTSVEGMPGTPGGSAWDPGEPFIYLTPDNRLVITSMKVDLSGVRPQSVDGAWLKVSSDGGRTWGEWTKAVFTSLPDTAKANDIDLTQDYFIDGKVIYASSRMGVWGDFKDTSPKAPVLFFKSTNNGETWQFINYMDPTITWGRTSDMECGIERVGKSEITAVIRGGRACEIPWLTRSTDMGRTWAEPVQADEKVLSWKRPRIYTYKHLVDMSKVKDIQNWWDDKLLLGTGVIQVAPDERNVGLWYSTDKGLTWSAPLPLDKITQDAGYGDLRMRRNGEIVIVSYHGSQERADIKQYIITMERSK